MNKIKRLSVFIILSVLLSVGCSSIDKKEKFTLTEEQKQELFAKGPVEALKEAQASIDQGINAKFDYFAPKHLKQSKELFETASKFINDENKVLLDKIKNKGELTGSEQKKTEAFFRKVALVKQYIEDGQKIKGIIEVELKEVFKQNDRLKELKALSEFPSEFEDIQQEIREIISDVEVKKELYVFKTRANLLNNMKDLEAKIVIKNTIKPTKVVFGKIEDKDYDEFAPFTFNQAQKIFESSTLFIKKNPRDFEGVRKAGADALLAANHALYIAKEVEGLREVFDEDIEKIEKLVLKYEALLNRIREALSMHDVRDRSLYDQSIAIAEFARNKISTNVVDQSAIETKKEEDSPAIEETSTEEETEKNEATEATKEEKEEKTEENS